MIQYMSKIDYSNLDGKLLQLLLAYVFVLVNQLLLF